MTTPQKSLVGLATLALSTALIAAPATAEPVTRYVEYTDLNLASVQGQTRLHERIKYAAKSVCNDRNAVSLAEKASVKKCKKEATDSAMQDAGIAIAKYTRDQRMASGRRVIVGN